MMFAFTIRLRLAVGGTVVFKVLKLSTNSGKITGRAKRFGELLQRVAVAEITNEDYELLSTLAKVNLSSEE